MDLTDEKVFNLYRAGILSLDFVMDLVLKEEPEKLMQFDTIGEVINKKHCKISVGHVSPWINRDKDKSELEELSHGEGVEKFVFSLDDYVDKSNIRWSGLYKKEIESRTDINGFPIKKPKVHCTDNGYLTIECEIDRDRILTN